MNHSNADGRPAPGPAHASPEPGEKKSLLSLFLVMVKVGAFAFGSGWSVIALLDREFIQRRGWITAEDLTDFMAVGRSLPGILAVNVAVLIGHQARGVLGGVVAALSVTLAPVITIIVIGFFYTAVRTNLWVAKALNGVRAAIFPMIIGSLFNMRKASIPDRIALTVFGAAFLVCAFTQVSAILVILAGGVFGLIYSAVRQRREPDAE